MFAGSVPYLRLCGIVLSGWQMARALLVAIDREGDDPNFYGAKIATARVFADVLLTQAPGIAQSILSGGETADPPTATKPLPSTATKRKSPEVEAEAARQYEASRAKTEAASRAAWQESVRRQMREQMDEERRAAKLAPLAGVLEADRTLVAPWWHPNCNVLCTLRLPSACTLFAPYLHPACTLDLQACSRRPRIGRRRARRCLSAYLSPSPPASRLRWRPHRRR